MEKVKILYVITKSVWGGAQRYVFDLAANLPKDKFDIMVACGGNGPLIGKLAEKQIRIIPVPCLERDINLKKEIISLFSLWRIFKREKPDIVHLNSSKIGGLGALAGRLSGVPKIIFTAHGWPFEENRNFLTKAVIWFLCWLTALFSHQIIVITKKDFKAAGYFPLMAASKINFIPNGIDTGAAYLGREESRKELNLKLPLGTILLGNIAEFTANKGLEYLIQSLKELPENIHLAIIGDGEEKIKMENLSQKLNLGKRIHFAGFKQDAYKFIRAFDIFVFSSIKEGLPYTILEAGLAGLPVVSTNVGGVPDVITNGNGGLLIPPKNPAALVNAVKNFLADKTLQKELGERLGQKIKTEFALEKMLEKTAALY